MFTHFANLHRPNQKLFYSKILIPDAANVILILAGQAFASVYHTTDTSSQAVSLWNGFSTCSVSHIRYVLDDISWLFA